MFKKSLGIAVLIGCGGCVSPISTMASHTIARGPDADQDVVWVLVGGALHRCTALENKPVCTRVPVGN